MRIEVDRRTCRSCKQMNDYLILWNLGDARRELASLVARVQQAAFGDGYA